MQTEFEVSIRLVFWGDNLDPTGLAEILGLEAAFYEASKKGDVQHQDKVKTHYVKTGRLIIYPHDKRSTTGGRDPDQQMAFLVGKLEKIGEVNKFSIEQAELQISLYYGNVVRTDEVEFGISDELMKHLCKHKIKVRITALP
jgi:hypothetical protein